MIVQILKHLTYDHDNHHFVLKKLKVPTGMACNHIDFKCTNMDKNVEYLSQYQYYTVKTIIYEKHKYLLTMCR